MKERSLHWNKVRDNVNMIHYNIIWEPELNDTVRAIEKKYSNTRKKKTSLKNTLGKM